MKSPIVHLASLICALLSAALVILPAEKPEKWIEVRSPNFTVITNGSEKDGRRVAEEFEMFRGVMQAQWPTLRIDPRQPVIIFAVKNEKTLKTLLPAYWEVKGHTHPAGIFVPGPEKHYAALRLDASGENPYHVLYHEYVHLIAKLNFPWLPLWLNEGLADFYASAQFRGAEIGVGRPSKGHLYLLQQQKLLPLEALLTADHDSPYYNEANKASVFYAQAWAVTHYFIVGDRTIHFKQLNEYLTYAVGQGQTEREAAERAFGDLKKFEKTINAYIESARFYYIPTKRPADIDEKKFAARDLTAAESAALLGDFYVHTRRPNEARARLQESIQQDPKLAAPHESMGLLFMQERNHSEAQRWFAEAVANDSRSFLTYYYNAMLSLQGGRVFEVKPRLEADLRRAIELNPKFAPAIAALAQFYLMGDDKTADALELARKAAQLEPSTLHHHLLVAQALLKMKKVEEARSLGQRVLAHARSSGDRMAAESFLEHLKNYSEYLQQVERSEAQRREYEERAKKLAEERRKQAGQETPADPSETAAPSPPGKPGKTGARPAGPVAPGEGVITSVTCNGAEMELTLTLSGLSMKLHSQNYFKVDYETTAWKAPANFDPCKHLKGREVQVEYVAVAAGAFAGELIRVEVRR